MEAIRGADLEPCQLSEGPMPSSMTRVTCPRACLDLASFGPALTFTGRMPDDAYTLVFVTACPGGGQSFNFGVEHGDGYLGFFPPGGLLDARTPEGYSNATLTVPAPVFEDALELHFPEISDEILRRGTAVRVDAAGRRQLGDLLSGIRWSFGADREGIIGPRHGRQLGGDLIAAYMRALRSDCGREAPAAGRRLHDRHRRLRKVREFIAAHLDDPLGLEELCREAGLSVRGTENLFRDLLGTTPIAYLRHQRLHAVRRLLLEADPEPGTVKRVALEMGFWHPGHFTHNYRRLFGECPSTTLARTTHRAGGRFPSSNPYSTC